MGLLSVSDAAAVLELDRSRVRALVASGAIPAQKVAGVWLIDSADVEARRASARPPGRPLSARNAWRVILLASGEPIDAEASAAARWRRHQALKHHRLAGLRPRLGNHADVAHFWAHPGELRALHGRDDIALAGLSAAGNYDLGLGGEDRVDLYLPAAQLQDLKDEHALEPAKAASANVVLRAVPDEDWLLHGRRIAPLAAVALNLADDPDPRLCRVGEELVAELPREPSAP